MPVANKSPRKPPKSGYVKKDGGPLTDASAPIDRDEKPLSKDGSKRGRIPGVMTKGQALLEDAQAIIAEKFDIKNFHPVIHMMIVAADESQDKQLRLNAASKAAPYVAQQLRSVELSGDEDKPLKVDLTDAKERLRKLAGFADDEDK